MKQLHRYHARHSLDATRSLPCMLLSTRDIHNSSLRKQNNNPNHRNICSNSNNNNNNHNHNNCANIFVISKRFRLPNPRLSVNKREVRKIDFRKERTGLLNNVQKHESYENLDWTNQDFLDDISSQHLANTYPEWHKHWMKNFIQFTSDEFDNFNFYKNTSYSSTFPSSSSSPSSSASNEKSNNNDNSSEMEGFSERMTHERRQGPKAEMEAPQEISDSLRYLQEWQDLLQQRKSSFKDDFEVRLPNGAVMTLREYMGRADKERESERAQEESAQQVLEYPKLDEFGRAYSRGKRKSAIAKVLVYPGHGNIYINSKHYGTYFGHYSERLNVALPLLITDTHRELDCYAVVRGGGTQGKSDAVRLAIARALVRYDPRLKELLAPYRLLVTDIRRRERKKPGKRGARRQEQWKIR